jgi:hypothetical protein
LVIADEKAPLVGAFLWNFIVHWRVINWPLISIKLHWKLVP